MFSVQGFQGPRRATADDLLAPSNGTNEGLLTIGSWTSFSRDEAFSRSKQTFKRYLIHPCRQSYVLYP